MAQPVKAATPDIAASGFAEAQVRVALAGDVMLRATDALLVVTVFPNASSTATVGWVGNAIPPVLAKGCVVNKSRVALPAAMVMLSLVATVSPAAVAVSV